MSKEYKHEKGFETSSFKKPRNRRISTGCFDIVPKRYIWCWFWEPYCIRLRSQFSKKSKKIAILKKIKLTKHVSLNLHYSKNLGIEGYRLYALTLYLRYPSCFRMVLRAQLQKYFQRKTYLWKERQKSFGIKRGLKLHRSRNLETDGFRPDALTLYIVHLWLVRMVLRASD